MPAKKKKFSVAGAGDSRDTELLDFLEHLRTKSGLTGRVLIGMDKTGRGFWLREAMPFEKPSHATVREAIASFLETSGLR